MEYVYATWYVTLTTRNHRSAYHFCADDPAAAFVSSYARTSYDIDGVYSQIRSWMKACSTHEVCHSRRHSPPRLPRRVLELVGGQCKLRETVDECARYVALSYCWGASQPCQLTCANIEAYKQCINLETLPKSIQHAAKVTTELGLSYLWADSMTIIQDNPADKLHEIASMHETYRSSTLTLCATGARDCNEGFFDTATAPGTSARTPDVGINYPCTLLDGSIGHVRLAERAQYNPRVEALASRGWTYQESVLPVSIVQFGACLSWECNEMSDRRTVTSMTGGIDAGVPFSTLFTIGEDSTHLMRQVLR